MPDDRKKVLVVVEDEPDMRMLIKLTLLRDPRIELLGEAANAADAIAVAESDTPGLIVLDHRIDGDIMGLDAAPMLKQAAPDAKILLFSAYDLKDRAGASPHIDAFLPKTEIGQLLSVSQRLLELDPL